MRPGQVIDDKFELVRLLGQGGMGEVWQGLHVLIGRTVALKFLHRELASDPDIVARFHREARAAAAAGSKNIVEVIDIGETDDGAPYLVLEYLEGDDLHGILKSEGTFDTRRAVGLLLQACRGLAAAHAKGVVHRDLKPDNLFLTARDDGSEWVKVLDFGIARVRSSTAGGDSGLTKVGTTIGTPDYMSPEQARGLPGVDHRTDVYSLGVILYQLLTGVPPFEGATVNDLIVNIATSEPRPPRLLRPDIPEGLEAVILRAMSREPEDRYQSVDELADALAPFGGDRQVATARVGTVDLGPVAPKTPPAASGTSTNGTPLAWQSRVGGDDGPPRPGRRRAIAATAGAVALIGAAVTLALLLSRPDRAREERPAVVVTSAPSPPAAPSSPRAEEAPAPPPLAAGLPELRGTVRLEVRAAPREARVRLDGVELPGNPCVHEAPRDDAVHELFVSAPGHRPYVRSLELRDDTSIGVALEPDDRRAGSAPGRPPGVDRGRPGVEPAPALPAAPAASPPARPGEPPAAPAPAGPPIRRPARALEEINPYGEKP